MAVENAVVELAAGTVGAGVFHQHVVVEMLATAADEEAIDDALSAFSGEYGMNVVAHQRAAQQQRMRSHVGAAGLLDAEGGEVEALEMLALEHDVLDVGASAGD